MNIISELKKTVTSCGNVLRGTIEVGGKEFIVETNLEKTWCNIIDEEGSQEGFRVDEAGDVIAESGEYLTGEFQDADWAGLTKFVGAK